MSVVPLLARLIGDPANTWAIGLHGALAEFRREPDEPDLSGDGDPLTVRTARGAMRLTPHPRLRPVAWEAPAPAAPAAPDGWRHGVAFCLPEDGASIGTRRGIAELGPDEASLLPAARPAMLFDLGLGVPSVIVGVRTLDPSLLHMLRAAAGQPLLAPDNPALPTIKAAGPHRVFLSALGRIEVYGRIPRSAAGEAAPAGPHTHLLPGLLGERRLHEPEVPVPAGLVPCLWLYPAHPLHDAEGAPHPFDAGAHAAFQRVLAAFGDPAYLAVKERVAEAVRVGVAPDGFTPPASPAERAAVTVALRQLRHSDGPSPVLEAWRARFDPSAAAPGPH
jgi:hypothetical protein